MSYAIRGSESGDLEPLLDLWEELMAEGTAADARFRVAEGARDAMRDHARDNWIRIRHPFPAAQVAASADEIVGYVAIKMLFPLPVVDRPATALFTDLYVRPSHRRRGVARALVNEAASSAVAAGISQFEVGTLALDQRAVAFWRSMGFAEWKVTLLAERW